MSRLRLLLLSNSTDAEGRYLHYPEAALSAHLAGVRTLTFVPFAGVTIGWDAYTAKVRLRFAALYIEVQSVHDSDNPRAAVESAEAIAVGGGNTFHLLATLQRFRMVDALRALARSGVPYVGWSAGSVVACPTIRTTNDMPIVEPLSLASLSLVPFQINAHFTDAHPPGFRGETRRERLAEFVTANPNVAVIGLPEGDWLDVNGAACVLHGDHDASIFRKDAPEVIAHPGDDLSALLIRPTVSR